MKGPSKRRFEDIFERGIRTNGALIRIIALPGNGLVGFATPRSLGAKPIRNHVRRRVIEAFRRACILPNLDIVVQIKAQSAKASFEDLCSDAQSTLNAAEARWAEQSESS